jgi:peptidyl-prolyl cis-trans isomerase SurA
MALHRIKLLQPAFIGISSYLVLVLAFFASNSYAQVNPSNNELKIRNIDGVVAVVNTGVVTRKEIDDRIASLQKNTNSGSRADRLSCF